MGEEVKFLTSAEPLIPAKFHFSLQVVWNGARRTGPHLSRAQLPQSAQTHSINHGGIMHSGCTCDKEWWSAEHRPGFACRFVRLYFSRATLRICRTWGGGGGGGVGERQGIFSHVLKNILICFDYQTVKQHSDSEMNCRIVRSQIPSRQCNYTRRNFIKGQAI